jgi:hypothetical protein
VGSCVGGWGWVCTSSKGPCKVKDAATQGNEINQRTTTCLTPRSCNYCRGPCSVLLLSFCYYRLYVFDPLPPSPPPFLRASIFPTTIYTSNKSLVSPPSPLLSLSLSLSSTIIIII